ncbi:MAG: hypothetical protein KatS3mg068_2359 [Candidatus Sericytochromatia bacterium]|nr:MAG: hypothetical protein KatS3mg068_2359 [Candidatus Sericytochromatia bacterium]
MVNTKNKFFLLNTWQISVGLTSLILGFLFSLQFKSQAEQRKSIPSRRIEDLTVMLRESEEKIHSLEETIIKLKAEIEKSKSNKNTNEDTTTKVLTGFYPLVGKGIIVTIDDSKTPLTNGENPNNGIVHNEDLLKITNELYAGGAEAIAINGQRLISNSEITCAGPTILVNKTRITPPFVISAIGNQDNMIATLEMRGGILETIKFFGLEVKIEKKDNIVLPAYNGNIDLKYSKTLNISNNKDF